MSQVDKINFISEQTFEGKEFDPSEINFVDVTSYLSQFVVEGDLAGKEDAFSAEAPLVKSTLEESNYNFARTDATTFTIRASSEIPYVYLTNYYGSSYGVVIPNYIQNGNNWSEVNYIDIPYRSNMRIVAPSSGQGAQSFQSGFALGIKDSSGNFTAKLIITRSSSYNTIVGIASGGTNPRANAVNTPTYVDQYQGVGDTSIQGDYGLCAIELISSGSYLGLRSFCLEVDGTARREAIFSEGTIPFDTDINTVRCIIAYGFYGESATFNKDLIKTSNISDFTTFSEGQILLGFNDMTPFPFETTSTHYMKINQATSGSFGVVKPDGTSITISNGVISAATQTPATATSSTLGIVKPDNTTITINNGVISAVGGSGGSSTLSDLTDTAISSPTNGQALVYDSTTSKWVNSSVNTKVTIVDWSVT